MTIPLSSFIGIMLVAAVCLLCLAIGISLFLCQQLRQQRAFWARFSPDDMRIDPEDEFAIDAAARNWAAQTGRTRRHADIAGDYLKLSANFAVRERGRL